VSGKAIALLSVSGGVLPRDSRQLLADEGLFLTEWIPGAGYETPAECSVALMVVGSRSDCFLDCLEHLSQARNRYGNIPAIALVSDSSEQTVVAALRAGVSDYLSCPFTPDEFLQRVRLAVASRPSGLPQLMADGTSPPLLGRERMVGTSAAMRSVKHYIGKVAETSSNVLITGDTGTGKELAAELIHRNSSRRDRPFVCINCAAMPETLIESELFGYRRGAFTGAHTSNEGRLASAHLGTVFFDEIGDMSPFAQAKILRVIESKQVSPLGSRSSSPSDFRVIAATNRNLEEMVETGDFRRDLFFRLNVARIHLPALRERKEDILALLIHCISEFNSASGWAVEGFTQQALETLLRHDWPGNVRELRNLVEAIFVTCRRGRISLADLPPDFWKKVADPDGTPAESDRLLATLFETRWNISRAADKLHWSRMTLYRKMEKYAISKSAPYRASAL
jgi:DNA-binding NtrC family response regulator